jgi:hypothetical protein
MEGTPCTYNPGLRSGVAIIGALQALETLVPTLSTVCCEENSCEFAYESG